MLKSGVLPKSSTSILLTLNLIFFTIGFLFLFVFKNESHKLNGSYLIGNGAFTAITVFLMYLLKSSSEPMKEFIMTFMMTFVLCLSVLPIYALQKKSTLHHFNVYRQMLAIALEMSITYTLLKLFPFKTTHTEGVLCLGALNAASIFSITEYIRDSYVFYEDQPQEQRRDIAPMMIITAVVSLTLMAGTAVQSKGDTASSLVRCLITIFTLLVVSVGVQTGWTDPMKHSTAASTPSLGALTGSEFGIVVASTVIWTGLLSYLVIHIIMKSRERQQRLNALLEKLETKGM